jgi:hypothetical protein
MSIQIVDNFKLNLNKPIDSRMVTNGLLSRNSIKYKYEGLRVYDIVDKGTYVYIDGSWKRESSTLSSSGSSTGGSSVPASGVSGGGGSLNNGTPFRIAQYTTTTTGGDSSIIDKSINFNTPNVGIGVAPAGGIALDVKGFLRSSRFMGQINGSQIDVASLNISKIIPHTVASGGFTLKSISGKVVWSSSTYLNTNIIINNESSDTATNYLLFSKSYNETTTGATIYANRNDATRFIGVKPSTFQILGSGDISNIANFPGYSFSGNNTSTGLYGNSTEVGLSFAGKALLKLNSTKLSIYNIGGNEVMYTGLSKVIFPLSVDFNSTLKVNGTGPNTKTTVGSLKVKTGTNIFTASTGGSLSCTTIDVTTGIGLTTIGTSGSPANLYIQTTTGITTFPTLNVTKLEVGNSTTGLTTLKNLTASGFIFIASLKLTTLNIPNFLTTINDLNIDGTNINFQKPFASLTINPNPSTGPSLEITQRIDFGTTLVTNQTAKAYIDSDGIAQFVYRKGINESEATNVTVGLGPGATKNTDNGLVECTKLKVNPTYVGSALDTPWFNKTTGEIENGTWDNNQEYPICFGYEPGDMICIKWNQKIPTTGNGYRYEMAMDWCIYTGRHRGWKQMFGWWSNLLTWPAFGSSINIFGYFDTSSKNYMSNYNKPGVIDKEEYTTNGVFVSINHSGGYSRWLGGTKGQTWNGSGTGKFLNAAGLDSSNNLLTRLGANNSPPDWEVPVVFPGIPDEVANTQLGAGGFVVI